MFQKMGFEEVSRSEVFGEVTLAVASDHEAFVHFLKDHVVQYSLSDHCTGCTNLAGLGCIGQRDVKKETTDPPPRFFTRIPLTIIE